MVAPNRSLPSSASSVLGWCLASVAVLALPPTSSAVTPDSPEVQRLIQSGLKYLDATADDGRLGARCLVGIALLKNGADANHPQVVKAVKACQAAVGKELRGTTIIYNLGLAVVFLCELDSSRYRTEIRSILDSILASQKGHGGWGYPKRSDGDTSVTQYAVLCLWAARQAGFDVPRDSVERVTNWLLRTQDPSGGWGYRGRDNGTFERQIQDQVTRPRTAAGLGSLMICAIILDNFNANQAHRLKNVPAVLTLIENPRDFGLRSNPTTQALRLKINDAIQDGDQWLQENYRIDQEMDNYIYYYLYALERYMSFRELTGESFSASPQWYDEGYAFLTKTLTDQGDWNGKLGRTVDTTFAVLFLSRSTRKSLETARSYGDGSLIGGRGLPSNIVETELRRGKIVNKGDSEKQIDLIKVLSDPNHPDYELLIESPRQAEIHNIQPSAAEDVERLRRLVHEGQPEQRIVAVRVLARTRDFDHVPTLLYAMTDPDWRVVREAARGLRFTSRTFESSELPYERDDRARDAAREKWRQWYLTIRPGAALDE